MSDCARCERPAFWFTLCDACMQAEIDARGRYVRKDQP